MKPNDIKAEIMRAGTNPEAIARHLNVSGTAVRRVIDGKLRSAKIEAEIIKITGPKAFTAVKPKAKRQKAVWTGRVLEAA